MTPTQKLDREERIAIMTADGISEAEAIEYCNSRPDIYDLEVKETTQGGLFR